MVTLLGWLVLILFFAVLAALPLTMMAVAVRPTQVTLRAAGGALLTVPIVVALTVLVGVLA